jgi:hypothetical protein
MEDKNKVFRRIGIAVTLAVLAISFYFLIFANSLEDVRPLARDAAEDLIDTMAAEESEPDQIPALPTATDAPTASPTLLSTATTSATSSNITPTGTHVLDMPTATPTPHIQIRSASHKIEIDWPQKIRLGDSDWVKLTIHTPLYTTPRNPILIDVADSSGTRLSSRTEILSPSLLESGYSLNQSLSIPYTDVHTALVFADIAATGFKVSPESALDQALIPGDTLEWYWVLLPESSGNHYFTISIFVKYLPLVEYAQPFEVKAATAPLPIRVVSTFGLTTEQLKIFGMIGTAASVIAAIYQSWENVEKLVQKTRPAKRDGFNPESSEEK